LDSSVFCRRKYFMTRTLAIPTLREKLHTARHLAPTTEFYYRWFRGGSGIKFLGIGSG
jgi:hypothetical protein